MVGAARLIIQQDRLDDRLHVAAHAGAVIVEDLCDAINIIAAGIARDQPLDELAADERPDVLVVKNGIQRRSKSCEQ